jgi:D-glycero-D-manno-heptose 1,7-bisphosphate phosphatase
MLVLLDRDGVINEDTAQGVTSLQEFHFLPRALEAIAMLTRAGFSIAVCTNQSAVGKGLLTMEGLEEIHRVMCNKVTKAGGRIDKIYSATEHPDLPSTRRKPAPGMLQEALQEFHADAAHTPFVGDALRDMEAAAALGCPRILTRTGKGAALEASGIQEHVAPLTVCDDLYAAAELICARYPT